MKIIHTIVNIAWNSEYLLTLTKLNCLHFQLFTVTEPPIILDIKVLERAKNNSNQIIMDRIISSMKS